MRIVLGVAGGIAAYKWVLLLRLFSEAGHNVRVMPTCDALCRRRHLGGALGRSGDHRRLRGRREGRARRRRPGGGARDRGAGNRRPARRAATGSATCSPPRSSSPTAPYFSPPRCTPRCGSTRPPRRTSRRSAPGRARAGPRAGRLTGGRGAGRAARARGDRRPALARRKGGAGPDRPGTWCISDGGTREPLDPVRYLGNRSSGQQGFALAGAARERGALVTLVAANLTVPTAAGVDVVHRTGAELRDAVGAAANDGRRDHGRRRRGLPTAHGRRDEDQEVGGRRAPVLELVEPVDILAGLVERAGGADRSSWGLPPRPGTTTGSVLSGTGEGAAEGPDLPFLNAVGRTRVWHDANEVTLLDGRGGVVASSCRHQGPSRRCLGCGHRPARFRVQRPAHYAVGPDRANTCACSRRSP